jgi:outer membrane receptor protein involved in Fe transport
MFWLSNIEFSRSRRRLDVATAYGEFKLTSYFPGPRVVGAGAHSHFQPGGGCRKPRLSALLEGQLVDVRHSLRACALLSGAAAGAAAHVQDLPQPESQQAESAVQVTPALAAAPAQLPTITVVSRATRKSAVRRPHREKPSPAPAAPSASAPASAADAPSVASGAPTAPSMASQMSVTGSELSARLVTRPGELLEAAPGLIVTQHSGEGKANQYFLRGYNLDHGTDLAITVDDMPINMRTHAHGQGYSDLNWLIPELVGSLNVRKGPYFADVGDFGSAGSLQIDLVDRLDKNLAQVTLGSFGYQSYLGIGSTKLGEGSLLMAGEFGGYNGPWANPEDMRKFNGLVRYAQGTATDGFSLTGMAYSNKWDSTDQVPQRAISAIGLFGSEDSSDGGNTGRFSLSARMAGTDAAGSWKANAYVIKSELDLFNNFTYSLDNPVQGDQFHQHDDRIVTGGNVSRSYVGSLAGLPTETTFGIQARYDAIDLALTDTFQRTFLSNIRSDKVGEGSVGIYAENTVHWTPWFRTTLGWRGDFYAASVDSLFDSNNSGNAHSAIGSPKFRMALGPFRKTELFLGLGMGMHSNDARGTTITEDPTDPSIKLGASPLLVRTRGAEIGVRSKLVPGLDSSLSLFVLDQASEIVFSGDAGDTEASRASERYGIEWTNNYRLSSWLGVDADLALTHARFLGFDSDQAALYESLAGFPQAQIGNAPGNYIPNAPAIVASAGITLGDKFGWSGALRWRYLGPTPLTEDNSFRSPATSIVNARIGYGFDNGWSVHLDLFNLLDTRANQITYAYGSLIKTDNLFAACNSPTPPPAAVCQTGVMDSVLHPIEPLAARLTVTAKF